MGSDMYRFLLRPRWIAGHVLLLVGVVTFVNLGFWQLRRLDERRTHNALVTERLEAPPVTLDELLATVGPDASALEYRRVTVAGRYQADGQVLTAPRSRDGRPGPQVLTVLRGDWFHETRGRPAPPDGGSQREDGVVLVDRGWIPFARDAAAPAPPAGDVRVEGIVRAPEPGDVGAAEQVARIVPQRIGERLGQPLPPYYVQLWRQQPPPTGGAPLPAGAPELSEGSHQSYALQWFSFALIALIGYPVLLWRNAREPAGGAVAADADDPLRERARIP